MNVENLSKEQRILRVMRKVLANIVKDATPAAGQPYPLTEATVHDIRDLFALISEREAELAAEAGISLNEKPLYPDQPRATNVVKLHKPNKAEQE